MEDGDASGEASGIMSRKDHRGREAAIVAAVLLVCLLATWLWRSAVLRRAHSLTSPEPWRGVMAKFPMPSDAPDVPEPAETPWADVLTANPFSPQRTPPPSSGEPAAQAQGAVNAASSPLFVYKGHIAVGKASRAILEETRTKQTYFAQPGQSVAGFLILEVTEERVVLQPPNGAEPIVLQVVGSRAPTKQTGSGQLFPPVRQ
mgnify:CR=1 FL=1